MSIYSDKLERIIKRASAGNPAVEKALRDAAEVEKAKLRLEQAVEEETTIAGAIEKALRKRTRLPGTSVAKAVADAYTPETKKATESEPTPEEQAQIDALAARIRKVRGDIEQSGIPRKAT